MTISNITIDHAFAASCQIIDTPNGPESQWDIDECWVEATASNASSVWSVGVSEPRRRHQTGWQTQTTQCDRETGGGVGYDDADRAGMDAALSAIEAKHDSILRAAWAEYLSDKSVESDCPRGFANEVNYAIRDGEPTEANADLLDLVMSVDRQREFCGRIERE